MALNSYASLQTAIAGWLNRTDLAARIPDFIALAEASLNRALRVRRMVGRSDATLSAEFIVLPEDFAGALSFELTGTTPVVQLAFAEPDDLARFKSEREGASGAPELYAIVGGQFQFFPAPDSDYAAELTYYKKIEPLSDAAPSNWALADHPDLYLYLSLAQAAPYLMDDDRVAVWAGFAERILAELNEADRRERSGFSLAMPRRWAP